MSEYIIHNGELYHYGVKGMRWGHRKRIDTPVGQARATYKQAKKDYNKSFNTAYKYSRRHPISQFTNAKRKAESDTLYTDAYNKAVDYDKAKTAYKQAKADAKVQRKAEKIAAKQSTKKTSKKTKKRASVVNTASNALFAKGMGAMVGAAVTMSGHKKAGEVIFKAGDVAAKAYIAKYGVDVARDAYDRSKAKRK